MHIRTNKTLNLVFRPVLLMAEWMGVHYPVTLIRLRYLARFGKLPNLKHPQTLNEKILYLSLYTDTSLWTICADKYKVREYITSLGLQDTLVKLYGVWENAEDIDFDGLPKQFVLKGNHGSGDILIVDDKNKIDKDATIQMFKKDLSKRFGAVEAGHHYLRIEPKVIAEELLVNDEETGKISNTLIDYKIWCFHGKAFFIWMSWNRHGESKDIMIYDKDWNPHPEYLVFDKDYHKGQLLPPPIGLSSMIEIAERLSKPFPEVRVDLYNLNGKIYFGELTFTSRGGLMTNYSEKFQILAGSMIDLSHSKIIR